MSHEQESATAEREREIREIIEGHGQFTIKESTWRCNCGIGGSKGMTHREHLVSVFAAYCASRERAAAQLASDQQRIAVEAERERCAKALCYCCVRGEPVRENFTAGLASRWVHDVSNVVCHASAIRALPATVSPGKVEKCGAPAASLIPRWGMSFACVLPKGHEGEHRQGGTCFKHGEYVGDKCPQWPNCIPNATEICRAIDPPAIAELERRDARVRLEEAQWWIECGSDREGDLSDIGRQRIADLQAMADAGEKEASDGR